MAPYSRELRKMQGRHCQERWQQGKGSLRQTERAIPSLGLNGNGREWFPEPRRAVCPLPTEEPKQEATHGWELEG